MSSPEPLIHWPQPILELLGFIAAFLATGAIGFRFVVLRPWLRKGATTEGDGALARDAARLSAILGLMGTLAAMALFFVDLQSDAAENHAALATVLGSDSGNLLQLGLGVLASLGFALAAARVRFGWYLALVGVIVGGVQPALFGQWNRVINPVHMLAGGMWIGTLFHVVVSGIRLTLRSGLSSEGRGLFVRNLVRRFSPLAMGSAGVLATFGVITAWRHLKSIQALWTTPYGITLILKLLLVSCVLALGAFNFRRQRPILGTEAGARSLRRSASAELAVATMVLIVTSILVSLPAPRRPSHSAPVASAATHPALSRPHA